MTLTPSQTVGPFFSIGLPVQAPTGSAITISGTVYDGVGDPVPDHVVETWQDDGAFRGFARAGDETGDGTFAVMTRKPVACGNEAPHIDVSVFARGLLDRVVTRIYFADEDNAGDAVWRSVPEARRDTLLAHSVPGGYRFDIRLQGDGETVFFDL